MNKGSNNSTDSIMTDVNLDNIEILDHANVRLSFSNSHDGEPCQDILCQNVLNLFLGTCGEVGAFPILVGDVKLQTLESKDALLASPAFSNAVNLSERLGCKLLLLESGEMNICLVCESVEQEGESDPAPEPTEDATPPTPTIPTPPPVSYPIYVARTYPDKESHIIVYSFGYDPDKLYAKFGVNSDNHDPYGINVVETIGKEA